MKNIEKAIQLLNSDINVLDNYLKGKPNNTNEKYFENELIRDILFAITTLEKQKENFILFKTPKEFTFTPEELDNMIKEAPIVEIDKHCSIQPLNLEEYEELELENLDLKIKINELKKENIELKRLIRCNK